MAGLYKYTPALHDPETLKATLVGRTDELKTIERILRNAAGGGSLSHALLIGPKGIGKTHLLRIIYHSLKGEIDVMGIGKHRDKFVPVIFSEEEYVTGVFKFFLLTLKYLRTEAQDIELPESLRISAPIAEHDRELLITFIRTFRQKTGRILLLLVDNFNDIVESFTDEDQSLLRDILMTSQSVLLIGSAPTLFQAIINHEKPFYNFFETIWLHDISFEETKTLLKHFTEMEGREDLLRVIEKREDKLRTIYELAGGNPRLILSLYHIMAEVDVSSVEEAFQKMLDEMSPYFRERMKDLSPQQREIIDVISQAEELLTPTEVARVCLIPVNQVNAQIKRLEEMGCLQKVTGRKRKGVLYDVRERLFSLWRQMRVEAGRKRLRFIIRSLEIWFSREELHTYIDTTLSRMKDCLRTSPEGFQKELDRLWYLKEATAEYRGEVEELLMIKKGKPELALHVLKEKIEKDPDNAKTLGFLGLTYGELGRYEEAAEAFKKSIKLRPDYHVIWYNLGVIYSNLDRYEEAAEAYKKAIELRPDYLEAWNNLGVVYHATGKYKMAIKSLKKAIELKPNELPPWRNLLEVYLKQYTNASLRGRDTVAINHLKEAMKCISKAGGEDEVFDVFVSTFKEIVKKGRIDALKRALEEIDGSEYKTLREALSPFYVLVRYLEEKDESILQRLRQEERIIVNEMLKAVEKKKR
ncbi:lipoprotein NlpI precursor [bacterium BMS3Abin08]|nr:lipoprotein NlpI precursor [bacterium BMS3Abin08]